MKIVEQEERGSVILRPVGRLDSNHSPGLEQAVNGVFERGDTNLVIDMSEVSYISSRGLRVFLVGAKRASASGVQLAVCSLQEFVKRAFESTGFPRLLGSFDSCSEALDSFASEPDTDKGANAESR